MLKKLKNLIAVLSAILTVFTVFACGTPEPTGGGRKKSGGGGEDEIVLDEGGEEGGDGGNTDPEPPAPLAPLPQRMLIGAWAPYFGNGAQANFDDIADAGFTFLMPMQYQMDFASNSSAAETILNHSYAAGLRVMVQDSGLSINGVWNTSNVGKYINHPSFMGNFIKDEPAPGEFPALKTKHDNYKLVFPSDKVFFVNLYPYNDPAIGFTTYNNYLEGCLNTVGTEWLSYDNHVLMSNGSIMSSYLTNLHLAAVMAKTHSVPLHNFVLSVPHTAGNNNFRAPSLADTRWQAAVNQAYGVRGFTYFTYMSPWENGYGEALVKANGEKTALYGYAKTVNNEILAWDDVYLSYKWQKTLGVNRSGTSSWTTIFSSTINRQQSGTVSGTSGIKSVVPTREVLLGCFENAGGGKAFMLTNGSNPNDNYTSSVQIEFDGYTSVKVYTKGVPSVMPLTSGKITIDLESGEGKFLIPL